MPVLTDEIGISLRETNLLRAAADHSASIIRQQVQCILSFSLWSRAITSFCSWLLYREDWMSSAHSLELLGAGGTALQRWWFPELSGFHISGCTTPCLCCRQPSKFGSSRPPCPRPASSATQLRTLPSSSRLHRSRLRPSRPAGRCCLHPSAGHSAPRVSPCVRPRSRTASAAASSQAAPWSWA